PTDLDVLLAGPTPSTNLVLMSDAGGTNTSDAPSVVNQTITFDDDAPGDVPSPLVTGTYRPTDNDPEDAVDTFPAPAPTPSSATTLATFNGSSANGTWTLWVVDDVQGSDSGSIAGGWCLTVTSLKATTTALSATPSPSTFGQAVTLKATVTSGGDPVTKGSVEFTEGATVLGSGPVTVGPDGTAEVTVTGLRAGDHTLTATYTAPSEFAESSTSVKQTVTKASTKTVLTSTPRPSRVGQEVTFTATVTVGDNPVPAGQVTFAVDGTDQLPVTVDSHGSATFKTSALTAGDHRITAAYSGTGDLAESDDTLQQTVARVITSTALTSSLNPSRSGDEVTLTATVTAGESTVTEGSVEFTEGTTSLGVVAVGPDGKASLSRAFTAGSHVITAIYAQTDTYATSTDDLTQVVEQALTSTVVTEDVDPTTYGQDVTFTATVTTTVGDHPLNGGTVQFSEGGTKLGDARPLTSGGIATLTANLLPAGPHTITATYSGAAEYAGSSGSADHTVDPANTTTTVVSSKTPSAFGQSVTFTATIAAVGTQVDTGTVEFAEGSEILCADVPVKDDGTVACTPTAPLPVGTHTITATYSGSPNYVTSSGTVSQVVDLAPTAIALTTSGSPSNLGDEVTFTASVTVNGGPLSDGTVAFSVDGTVVEASATLDADGHATFPIATLTAGPHTIVAGYSGTPSYKISTSNTVDQIVVLLVDAGGPYGITEGEDVTLDGSGSSPGAESYEWDLNHDGVFGDVSGPTPALTWAELESFGIDDGETVPTIYPVALQVKSGTETKIADTSIIVTNTAPTAMPTGGRTATVGVPFTIKVGADDPSSADLAANFTYTLDWGDGVVESVVGPADPPVTHTYAAAGTVTASFTATDKDGGQSGSATIEIAVDPPGGPTTSPPTTSPPTTNPPTTNPTTTNPTSHGGGNGNGSLASTGASIGIGPIVFGAALLIAGSALLVMARRRRATRGGHE
ncbi:MAG TPA: Ig-like domain repeat protein, partial [Microlunatus sp.]|nr:Ig-like domain repeat protein [Microlunatus sp.]